MKKYVLLQSQNEKQPLDISLGGFRSSNVALKL